MAKSILIALIFMLNVLIASAQCSVCTFTASTGGNYDGSSGAVTLCFTSNTGNVNINNWGTDDVICINNGITWTQTNSFNIAGIINVNEGTFNMNFSPNFNSSATINIANGGFLNTNVTNLNGSNNLTINNSGTVTFTASSGVTLQNITINNASSGIIDGLTPSSVTIVGGNYTNNGSMLFANLENNEANSFVNNGTLTVKRNFYNHGSFTNNGCVSSECGSTTNGNSYSCQFRVGNKGATKEFKIASGKCATFTGDVVIEGATTIAGTLVIKKPSSGTGNFTANYLITNTGGNIIVEDGTSTVGAAGRIVGGKFTDRNTVNGYAADKTYPVQYGLDANNGNSPFSTFTIDNSITSCNCSSGTSPVTISEFNVTVKECVQTVRWVAQQESGIKQYEIQRSTDANNYWPVLTSNPKGNGVYSFALNVSSSEKYFYRLKIYDLDGKITYSEIASVQSNNCGRQILLYPIPAKGYLNVQGAYLGDILQVYDKKGALMVSQIAVNSNINSIDLRKIPSGAYLLVINGDRLRLTKEFIIN